MRGGTPRSTRTGRRWFILGAAAAAAACSDHRPRVPARPIDPTFFGARLDPNWLPSAPRGAVQRVVVHWTGGSYEAAPEDLEHYHFIIEGDAVVRRGRHAITANARRLKRGDAYARHTRRLNSNSVGVAVSGMRGARQAPFADGDYPILERQWRRLAGVCADIVDAYGVAIDPTQVLTHAEVGPGLGVDQGDKWDIPRLPFAPSYVGHREVGSRLRVDVAAAQQTRMTGRRLI